VTPLSTRIKKGIWYCIQSL